MRRLFPLIGFIGSILLAQNVKGPKPGPMSWLDATIVRQWNRSGRTMPHAPRGSSRDGNCKGYKSAGGSESDLAKSGWLVTRPGVSHNEITVVEGQAANDGMCRPTQYQEFVFINGDFAGTLSPVLMNSRSDGAAANVRVPGDGRIVVAFLRYSERDPLCCPSRTTEVEYTIVRVNGKPLVSVKGTRTHPND